MWDSYGSAIKEFGLDLKEIWLILDKLNLSKIAFYSRLGFSTQFQVVAILSTWKYFSSHFIFILDSS